GIVLATGSELWRERAVREAKYVEEGAHDRGGSRDDDAGHDAHFALGITALHLFRSAPDVDDSPNEADHEEDSQTILEPGLHFGGDLREREERGGGLGFRTDERHHKKRTREGFFESRFHGWKIRTRSWRTGSGDLNSGATGNPPDPSPLYLLTKLPSS